MSEKITEKIRTDSGIILFAKRSGRTSFASLYEIKRALGTKKVGHTGTLDSFACGLLVVCTGKLTRLASHITAFDKTYEAVICFGTETDTLDPTGTPVRRARLPSEGELSASLKKFTGTIMQRPPAFSAIHIDGKRASSLARGGQNVDIPARPVTVYDSEILELKKDSDNNVSYARIGFVVSKGTYIRSLARDIGSACGSAAYLSGLMRTTVGSFRLEDASGAQLLPDFTIDGVLSSRTIDGLQSGIEDNFVSEDEIRTKLRPMTLELAHECGLQSLILLQQAENDFYNGKSLSPRMFAAVDRRQTSINMRKKSVSEEDQFAVFTEAGRFSGIVKRTENRLQYVFVVK